MLWAQKGKDIEYKIEKMNPTANTTDENYYILTFNHWRKSAINFLEFSYYTKRPSVEYSMFSFLFVRMCVRLIESYF